MRRVVIAGTGSAGPANAGIASSPAIRVAGAMDLRVPAVVLSVVAVSRVLVPIVAASVRYAIVVAST